MLRFIDSFDHYSTNDLLGTGNGQKWSGLGGSVPTTNISISNGTGRFQSSLHVNNSSSSQNCYIFKVLDNQATWIVGFAFKISTLPTNRVNILAIIDSGTAQVELSINSTGTLQVTRNGSTVTSGTSTNIISINTWYYIEMSVTISASISANTWEVNVNGVNWINVAAGQSSKNSSNTTANTICIGIPNFTGNNYQGIIDFDDLYICDGTGSTNNTFLGDCRVESRLPLAAGTYTDWSAQNGNSYTNVADLNPNGDTNYIYSSTVNQQSTFTLPALASTPSTIFGVQALLCAKKSDAGPRTFADVIKSSTTTNVGSTFYPSAGAYNYFSHILETDPATSAAWTASAANAIEVGAKLLS